MNFITMFFSVAFLNEVKLDEINKPVETCINNVIEAYFNQNDLLITYIEDNDFNFPNKHPRIALNDAKTIKMDEKVKNYLIVTRRTKMERILIYLKTLYSWNNKARFLLVSILEDKEALLDLCFKHHLTSVVVLDANENLELFTWNWQRLCNNGSISKSLGPCEDLRNFSLFQPQEVNWEGCPLKIAPMEIAPYVFKKMNQQFDGLEIRALRTIQEKMRFNVTFLNHTSKTWGLKKRDGNYTDLFGLLQIYHADIVMGMWPTNYTESWDFDVSFSYFEDVLVWSAPKAKLQTHWKSIVSIFEEDLWYLLVTLIFVQGVLWKVVGLVLGHEASVFRKLGNCLIYSLSVIFNLSINKGPRTFSLKMLFVSWVYASLIIVTIYQSKLIASLTKPNYEYQISNIEDLVNSKLSYGGNINIKTLFNNSLNSFEEIIYENIIICDLSLTCANRTAFQKDFAIAKSKLPTKFLITKYYTNPDGTPMIYIFQDAILFHFVNMIFWEGHPIFKRFNEYLVQFSETGFFLKWLGDINFDEMKGFYSEDKKIFALTLGNIVTPFIILFIGLGISFLVFVLELFFGRINKIKT